MQQDLSKALDNALDHLKKTWEDIGIIEDQQVARMEVVMGHVRGLLTAMVEEEEGLKEKLMKNVEQYGEEVLKLCKELHRPRHQVSLWFTSTELLDKYWSESLIICCSTVFSLIK